MVRKALTVLVLVVAVMMASCQSNEQQISEYRYISAENLLDELKNKDFFLIDVHVPEQDHIIKTDAFIPYYDINKQMGKLPNDKRKQIILYCLTNTMSIEAYVELKSAGYTNLLILDGGTTRWRELGYPFK